MSDAQKLDFLQKCGVAATGADGMHLSVNLDTVYSALAPLDRFAGAAGDGFEWVEFWAPQRELAAATLAAVARHRLHVTLINTHAGPGHEDFGQLGNPERIGWWRADFERTLGHARSMGAEAINVLVGGRQPGYRRSDQIATVLDNLSWALNLLDSPDPVLLIEPLNGADRRSPLIRSVDDTMWVMGQLDLPARLRLLFDVYHLVQEEDCLTTALNVAGAVIGHVQVADFPGRHEPGTGRIPFRAFLSQLALTGYQNRIGLEYFPSGPSTPVPGPKTRRTIRKRQVRREE